VELQRCSTLLTQKKGEMQTISSLLEDSGEQLERSRRGLQELSLLSEREHQTMALVAQRLQQLRTEISSAEDTLRRTNNAVKAESDKQKTVQTLATEQLRVLQVLIHQR
jgi:uncharacterized protein YukE